MFAGSGTILETGRQAQNLEFAGHCKITSKSRKTFRRAERYLLSKRANEVVEEIRKVEDNQQPQ
jgi:hypothetical protein